MSSESRTAAAFAWSPDPAGLGYPVTLRVAPSSSTAATREVLPETTSAMATTTAHWRELADPAFEPSRTRLGSRLRLLRQMILATGTRPLDAEEVDIHLGRKRSSGDT